MPKLIEDEFTHQPLSAARKYQLRHARDGLCRACRRQATHPGPFCERHWVAQIASIKASQKRLAARRKLAASLIGNPGGELL